MNSAIASVIALVIVIIMIIKKITIRIIKIIIMETTTEMMKRKTLKLISIDF